jgi:hypothetical protein
MAKLSNAALALKLDPRGRPVGPPDHDEGYPEVTLLSVVGEGEDAGPAGGGWPLTSSLKLEGVRTA